MKSKLVLTEQYLAEQLEKKKQEREVRLTDELNKWCIENNCVIIPSIEVVINGKKIGISLKAL